MPADAKHLAKKQLAKKRSGSCRRHLVVLPLVFIFSIAQRFSLNLNGTSFVGLPNNKVTPATTQLLLCNNASYSCTHNASDAAAASRSHGNSTGAAPEQQVRHNVSSIPVLSHGNSTRAADERQIKHNVSSIPLPRWCMENSVENIRQTAVHFDVKAGNASVSMYRLDTGMNTLGVHLAFETGSSPSNVRRLLGRNALVRRQQQLGKRGEHLPKVNMRQDGGSAPRFDDFLGCDNGESPSGVAVVVVQNFYCPNIWHSLANNHGVWLLMQVSGIRRVSDILPREHGSPFLVGNDAKHPADALWPLYLNSNNSTHTKKNDCFKDLLWIETPKYRPGPYWSWSEGPTCPLHSQYMETHRSFHREAHQAVSEAFGIMPTQKDDSEIPVRATVCYMSRRRRKGRVRYFSEKIADGIESSLLDWAAQKGVEYFQLEFDEKIPFAEQVRQTKDCNVLFGPHGAGLGHQIWMTRGFVIEFGDEKSCANYYSSMATWYGHKYVCFSEFPPNGIRIVGGIYQSFNVSALIHILDTQTYLNQLTI